MARQIRNKNIFVVVDCCVSYATRQRTSVVKSEATRVASDRRNEKMFVTPPRAGHISSVGRV